MIEIKKTESGQQQKEVQKATKAKERIMRTLGIGFLIGIKMVFIFIII
jgi:hypothetical protein